jgi:hypothetical protein
VKKQQFALPSSLNNTNQFSHSTYVLAPITNILNGKSITLSIEFVSKNTKHNYCHFFIDNLQVTKYAENLEKYEVNMKFKI